MNRMRRMYQVMSIVIGITALLVSSRPVVRAEADTPPAAVIRITPPAPVFDDAKRLEELAARRKQVADTIGKNSMLVLFSAEPRVYTNDVDFPFRQENNLFYLTNLNQKRITLVIIPSQNPAEILFLPRRSPAAETWTGHMYSPEEAALLSGINEIWEASEFDGFIKSLQQHDTSKEAYNPKPENILLSKRETPQPGLINENLGAFSLLYRAADAKQASVYLLANPPANAQFESR